MDDRSGWNFCSSHQKNRTGSAKRKLFLQRRGSDFLVAELGAYQFASSISGRVGCFSISAGWSWHSLLGKMMQAMDPREYRYILLDLNGGMIKHGMIVGSVRSDPYAADDGGGLINSRLKIAADGAGGGRASAALPLFDDVITSPASRRLASAGARAKVDLLFSDRP